jgi:predicted nucleic acid-binding protein
VPVFFDTNVLIYSVSNSPAEAHKRQRSESLLDRSDGALSIQVLQEFYVQITRPSRSLPMPHDIAVDFIRSWRRHRVVDNTVETLLAALAIKERYGFSYWDSAVIAAARAAGCSELFTEDLSHGQFVEGVLITNPFRQA